MQWILKRAYSIARQWSFEEATRWMARLTKDTIPKDQVQIAFSRSSGPGGQNVNKVSTKVDLRLQLDHATWIPDYARTRLLSSHRLTKAGELVITSDRTRSQAKNIQDCYDKLLDTIKAAVAVPREPDASTLERVKTLRYFEDKQRKDRKKRQAQKKSSRRSRGSDDY